MKRRLVQILIVLLWVLTAAWLIRYEAFPQRFAQKLAGYRGVMSSGAIVLDSWMLITFQGHAIGYSHTMVDTDEQNPLEQYLLNNRTVLHLNLMGEAQKVAVSVEAALDALYQLQRFYFGMTSRRYSVQVEGRRWGKRRFSARITTDAGSELVRLTIPDDVVIYSPFVEMSMARLRPGQSLSVRTIDPATLTTMDVLVKAVRRENVTVRGEEHDTLLLTMEMQGMESRAWIDREGRILREETPFGWTMEASTPEEAMELEVASAEPMGDMLRALSVPCEGAIGPADAATAIRYRLGGLTVGGGELATHRQSVEATGDRSVDLTVRAEQIPPPGEDDGATAEELAPYLAATAFVQANDPGIAARAREITDGLADPAEKARALYHWVYRKVKKEPTVSLPSAVDVLKAMEGDCNEHTYLFVALARAAGLPAQICIGLVYNEGTFYYHAWPAVHVGRWWEMDPTVGQESVDATHIRLLEGELASQLRLLGMIGNLSVEVLPGGTHD